MMRSSKVLEFKKKWLGSSFESSWLLPILKFINFNVHFKPKTKILPKIFSYFMHIFSPLSIALYTAVIYSLTALLCKKELRAEKHRLTGDMCIIFSVLLWIYLNLHSEYYCKFVRSLHKIGYIDKDCRKEAHLINVTIVLMLLIPVMISSPISIATIFNADDAFVEFWTLGNGRIENRKLEFAVIFLCITVYMAARFVVPSLSLIIHSAICYELSKALRFQTKVIENSLLIGKCSAQVRTYHLLIERCKIFGEKVKVTMFVMIADYFMIMYLGLTLAIGNIDFIPKAASLAECVVTVIVCVFSVVGLIHFASEIPKSMIEASARFQLLYREELIKPGTEVSNRQILILKALSEITPVYLTGFDMFQIDKGLILTSFGCTLTYCILIMQLKKNEFSSSNVDLNFNNNTQG